MASGAILGQFFICICLGQSAGTEKDWTPLFNGKNYAGFNFWIPNGPEETFLIENGCMAIRGYRAGYAYTIKKYRNYELRYQWRFIRPADLKNDAEFKGNSGVFLHLSRILKEWPRSVEAEGRYAEMGKLIAYEKVKGEFKDYPQARQAAMKPVGEWNANVIVCKEGHISVTINGKLIAEGQLEEESKTNPWEGFIGFQAQGADIDYKDIQMRERP
jgi:hypothetical protein